MDYQPCAQSAVRLLQQQTCHCGGWCVCTDKHTHSDQSVEGFIGFDMIANTIAQGVCLIKSIRLVEITFYNFKAYI